MSEETADGSRWPVAGGRGRCPWAGTVDRGPSTGWPTLSLPSAAAAESAPAPAADYCR
jgi:hypothetical protein